MIRMVGKPLPKMKFRPWAQIRKDGYNPMYWVEGTVERNQGDLTDEEAERTTEDVYAKGWRGITYWGADRDGGKMIYYFNSPSLKSRSGQLKGRMALLLL